MRHLWLCPHVSCVPENCSSLYPNKLAHNQNYSPGFFIDPPAFQGYNRAMPDALSARVLVLNRLWQAIHIVDAKRALCLLFSGHARVLCASEEAWQVWPAEEWMNLSQTLPGNATDIYLHSINCAIRVPKIILTFPDLTFSQFSKNSPWLNLLWRMAISSEE